MVSLEASLRKKLYRRSEKRVSIMARIWADVSDRTALSEQKSVATVSTDQSMNSVLAAGAVSVFVQSVI